MTAVVGRDRELERIAAFLERTEDPPAVLLLEGMAGIGKTTLWRWGVDQAGDRDYRVLLCRPNGSEAALSYAALGDLFGDVILDALDALPLPQRRALEIALLLEDSGGQQPDQRSVGVAVLGVLRTLSREGPLLLAIDDVQWLDAASAAALDFALRRVRDEPVAVLAARRLGLAGGLELAGAERLEVGPLSLGAIHRMLLTRLETTFPRSVLVRLHEAAAGNAFYSLELGRALARRDRASAPGEPIAVPEDVAGLLRERLDLLSPDARSAAAAAAALAKPTIDAVVEACGGERHPLQAAIAADVVELDGERVRFTHPLLAASVYGELWPPDRRALHARLAAIVGDAEERARHLALAAEGPDEEVAAALDAAARLAARRGAQISAAELAELAVQLTPAARPEDVRQRELAAAELHLQTGDIDAARTLLEHVLPGAAGAERARTLLRLAQTVSDDAAAAVDALDQALLAGADDRLLVEIGMERAGWRMALGDLGAARHEARSALLAARRTGDRPLVAFAVADSSLRDVLSGEPPDLAALAGAVEVEQETFTWPSAYPPSLVLGMCLMYADRLEEARELLETAGSRADERGSEWVRSSSLLHLAECEIRAGRYERAAECADRGLQSVEQMGHTHDTAAFLYVAALTDAYRGRVDAARTAADTGLALAEETGDTIFAAQNRGVLGFLELSIGDAAAADRQLRPLWPRLAAMGYGEPSVYPVLPNAIEAMIRTGELAEAATQLAELERCGMRLDSAWALAQAARCRGLLAAADGDTKAAERHFEHALAEHDRLPGQFERGRTLLAIGAVRRRAKRKGAARESLGEALAIFEELGAPLWAEQTTAELASIGGRKPSGGELTPTERRVAELVAGGMSTKQAAAALVVSTKTVDGHLSHIYAKLDIHSRTQLARRLASDRPE